MMKLRDKKHLSIAIAVLFAAVTLCACTKIEKAAPVSAAKTDETAASSEIVADAADSDISTTVLRFNYGYVPEQFAETIAHIYALDLEPARNVIRYAAADSSARIMVQCVKAGSDEIAYGNAESVDIRDTTGRYFTVSDRQRIAFTSDVFKVLGLNSPIKGDNMMIFTAYGYDYYVYGNLPRSEIIKVADELIVLTPEQLASISGKDFSSASAEPTAYTPESSAPPQSTECPICGNMSVVTKSTGSYTSQGEIIDCINFINGQDRVIEHHTYYQSLCSTPDCPYQSAEWDTISYTSLECHGWT